MLVVLLPYGVCFSCFALKAGFPVTQISLKLTVAQVGAELEILLPQPPKCWDCRSGPSQLASLPGWDLEQASLFSPSLPGLNSWCLDASCGLLLRVGLAARLAPHTVPTGSPSRVSVSPHPFLGHALPGLPGVPQAKAGASPRKARQTLLIHALMPVYPVTLRSARVSRTSLKASVSQESYNKI